MLQYCFISSPSFLFFLHLYSSVLFHYFSVSSTCTYTYIFVSLRSHFFHSFYVGPLLLLLLFIMCWHNNQKKTIHRVVFTLQKEILEVFSWKKQIFFCLLFKKCLNNFLLFKYFLFANKYSYGVVYAFQCCLL